MYKTRVLNSQLSLLWNATMPRLDPFPRNNVICHLQAGQTHIEVARQFNVYQSTISRLWQRFNQTGSAQDSLEEVGHTSLLQHNIDISGRSIYVIDQSLLLTSQVYGKVLSRQSITGFSNAEFGQEALMLEQFWPRETLSYAQSLGVASQSLQHEWQIIP